MDCGFVRKGHSPRPMQKWRNFRAHGGISATRSIPVFSLFFRGVNGNLVERQPQRSQAMSQRRAVEAEQLASLPLVAVRVFEDLREEKPFDRGNHLLVKLV